ncbi:MAG: LysM peptidoglycan-binding domain-containing protein, partial [Solirubrobacterales bacterium]
PKVENPLTRIENILDRLTSQVAQNDQTVNMNVPSQSESPATVERQSPLPTTQPRTEVAAETTPQNTDQPKPAATQAAKPVVTTPKPTGKIYVVGEGETLSSVAKNVYGPEDGNRIANIRRIYEVNKDILKSEHEVVAGQKLVIPPALPPLPKVTTVNPDKPSDVLSKELFEKVEMIAKRPTASQTQTPTQTTTPPQAQKPAQTPVAATAGTRLYTVQDGDNLWKIASTQLGAGARYEEIAKLNADLLKDGAKLGVGMKIRLPQK